MHMMHALPCKVVHAALLQSAKMQHPCCCCYFHRRPLRTSSSPQQVPQYSISSGRHVPVPKTPGHLASGSVRLQTCNQRLCIAHSNSARRSLASWICEALSASRDTSVAPDSVSADIRAVLSETEGSASDDEAAESALDVSDVPNTELDEAITGYMQDESTASIRVVKSRAEAHEQVRKIAASPLIAANKLFTDNAGWYTHLLPRDSMCNRSLAPAQAWLSVLCCLAADIKSTLMRLGAM